MKTQNPANAAPNASATPFSSMFSADLFKNLSVPGVDVEALFASQKKNLEAIAEANRVAVEGLKAVTRRQEELVREAIGQVTAAVREVKSPEQIATLAVEATQRSLDQAREIAELAAKANREVLEVVTRRAAASLDELKASVKIGKA